MIENLEKYLKNDIGNSACMSIGESIGEAASVDNSQNSSLCARERPFIHISNFCVSAGFLRKKFSSNHISSLYFMSPERICGEIDVENDFISSKADVWSIGVLLFLLVFGKPPFDGKLNTSLVK